MLASTPRQRLADSPATIESLQGVLKKWFVAVGHRHLARVLETVEVSWARGPMPSPFLLADVHCASLVKHIASADATVHPRHARLSSALHAEHQKHSIVLAGRPELECLKYARLMLLICSKFRTLKMYVAKSLATKVKAGSCLLCYAMFANINTQ